VHGVQKNAYQKWLQACELLSLTRCQGISASVPSSINWMNTRYEAATAGREMFLSVSVHRCLDFFVKTKTKTSSSRVEASGSMTDDQDQDFHFNFQDQEPDHFSCPRGSLRPRPRSQDYIPANNALAVNCCCWFHCN